MLFNKVKEQILKNAELKATGAYIGIPMPYRKLADYIPSFDKGMSIGILGTTGSGKSFFTRYTFIYHIYKFYKQTGYNVRILYFPLEDNKEKVYRNIIQNYLSDVHGVRISTRELDSKADRHLPTFIKDLLKESDDYFEEFEKIVSIIDGTNKPEGLYKICEDFALSVGTIVDDNYESDVHTLCIFDNLSNLDEDGYRGEKDAMTTFARDYVRARLCNFYKFTCVQVLQSDFQTERQQYSSSGETIVSKLEPSLASVGESKTITRSMHLVLSLFPPYRYEILQYPKPPKTDPDNCYNIELLKNKFLSLKVIKANDSEVGIRVGLYIDHMDGTFVELPSPKTEELRNFYKRISQNYVPFTKQKQLTIEVKEDLEDLPF